MRNTIGIPVAVERARWHTDAARGRRGQDDVVMVKPASKKVEKFRGVEL